MRYSVVVDRQARDDLVDIHAYIARDNPGAAARWIDELEEIIQSLADMPGRVPLRDDLRPGYRIMPIGNYLIFFRIIEQTVQVVRVIHGARDIDRAFDEAES